MRFRKIGTNQEESAPGNSPIPHCCLSLMLKGVCRYGVERRGAEWGGEEQCRAEWCVVQWSGMRGVGRTWVERNGAERSGVLWSGSSGMERTSEVDWGRMKFPDLEAPDASAFLR